MVNENNINVNLNTHVSTAIKSFQGTISNGVDFLTSFFILYALMDLATIIPPLQMLLSVVLVGLILLQSGSEGGLGAMGGGDAGAGYHTRRGLEKILFNATIVVAILFGVFAVLALLVA